MGMFDVTPKVEATGWEPKQGDIVYLNVGGPPLVVAYTVKDQHGKPWGAHCQWWNENNDLKTYTFFLACLNDGEDLEDIGKGAL